MKRRTTPRRHVAGGSALTWSLLRLGVVELVTVLTACAPPARYETPGSLRGYEIVIARRDSLARELAPRLRARGFRVRDHLNGGSRPTALLFTFTFRETEPPALTWLHVRLADTRTGEIVGAVSAPLDSLGATPADRARAIVDSLAAQPGLNRALQPTCQPAFAR